MIEEHQDVSVIKNGLMNTYKNVEEYNFLTSLV